MKLYRANETVPLNFNSHDPTNTIHPKLAYQSVGRLPFRWFTADYQHQKAVALRPDIVRT